jgi:hypothetical protein
MVELIGTLLKIATAYIILSTVEGRKKIPYKEINILDDMGRDLEELRKKKIKVIIWEDGTIEIRSPKG